MKTALITGVSGQDSIELSNLLLSKDYTVYVGGRRNARSLPRAINSLKTNFGNRYNIINLDITDLSSIVNAINISKPQEFYNLAAQSHVGLSFKEPISTCDITGIGVLNCLEAIRMTDKNIRFYQAGSSEQFGGLEKDDKWVDSYSIGDLGCYKINEKTAFKPKSPYACAKVFGHNITANYRESYGLHASVGILFNHEGIHRKIDFVTRKVTVAATKIFLGVEKTLELGTLDFGRDWGHAKDYVEAMWLMLQQDKPDDYVIATGEINTATILLETAFGHYDINWRDHVKLSDEFKRPSDVKILVGDATKAKNKLGWEPKTSFPELIELMCQHDYETYKTFGEINE